MNALLQLQGVAAGYRRGQSIIEDISLGVEAGQLVAVLGANGAGKSTLLRTILGQLQPNAGSITLAGRDLGHTSAAARVELGIALVPQAHQVFGGLSVYENLRMGAYVRRRTLDIPAAMQDMFRLFPVLEERRTQLAASLSGGERAMLAVGRGLMSEPRVLLLDEPSQGLSPKMRRTLFDTIARLSSEAGLAVLVVEQDVALALGACDYAYVLQAGRIVAQGHAEAVAAAAGLRHAA